MMTCAEFQDLLHRRLDGKHIQFADELRHHLENCPECRQMYDAGEAILKGLSAWPVCRVPEGLSTRLTTKVLADRRARQRLRRLTLTALAASILIIAASAALSVFVQRPVNPLAKQTGIAKVTETEELPRLSKSVDDARLAVSSISSRWRDNAREQTSIILSAAKPIAVPDLDSPSPVAGPLAPAAHALRVAGHEVADSLQPVANGAGRALAYLFKELPVIAD